MRVENELSSLAVVDRKVSARWKADYAAAMKEIKKHFAYDISTCKAVERTLRNSQGSCIQCNTTKLPYTLRSSKGWIEMDRSFGALGRGEKI